MWQYDAKFPSADETQASGSAGRMTARSMKLSRGAELAPVGAKADFLRSTSYCRTRSCRTAQGRRRQPPTIEQIQRNLKAISRVANTIAITHFKAGSADNSPDPVQDNIIHMIAFTQDGISDTHDDSRTVIAVLATAVNFTWAGYHSRFDAHH